MPGSPAMRTTSGMGQSRHFGRRPTTSGPPLETDIIRAGRHVSKVPTPEVAVSFDHLIGATEQHRWHFEAERFSSLEVDYEIELLRPLYR